MQTHDPLQALALPALLVFSHTPPTVKPIFVQLFLLCAVFSLGVLAIYVLGDCKNIFKNLDFKIKTLSTGMVIDFIIAR
ncbi:hypothetical protein CMU01_07060 [Elizabethkingia anophelis]|nr:hypothetical protein [Elizabethkingia anophelis]